MKWLSKCFPLLCFILLCHFSVYSQIFKAPIAKPTEPVKKKTPTKPIVKLKDDDDDDVNKPTKPVETAFAYLLIKSNKGSSVIVTINDSLAGRIKANMAKRIPLSNYDELKISLNDGQGNIFDSTIFVTDFDQGKNIIVSFPEIDYAAIKAEELRIKKEEEEIIRKQKEEEARIKREQEEEIKRQKEEEARIKREQEEALRLARIDLLKEREKIIKEILQNCSIDKNEVLKIVEKIKTGELDFDEKIKDAYAKYNSSKLFLNSSISEYIDSATSYKLVEKKEIFLKEIKPELDKTLKDEFNNFITNVPIGKIPQSNSIQTAIKASRSNDIKFFLPKDSLDEAVISGKRPILFALESKSNSTIFKYLFENGVDPNNYGSRFPENSKIYLTPLAIACINGDTEVIKEFAKVKARFYPDGFSKLDRKEQNKFLLSKFGSNKEVLEVLKNFNYDLDDGSAAIKEALAFLDSAMVFIEGGEITIGCTDEQASDCVTDEKPAVKVTIKDFYMCKYEIPQKVWIALMEDENPSSFTDCLNCPVETVGWNQIQGFIKRLNEFSGKTYRLPNEAEWEYAARGGKSMSTTKNFIFAGSDNLSEVGWYKSNSIKPQPIGLKKPNILGLYDMSGNVSEWCNNWYAEDFYKIINPLSPNGPEVGALKVARGGSFTQDSWGLRVSNRWGDNPETYKKNFQGFRLVLDK